MFTPDAIEDPWVRTLDSLKKTWYKFSRNWLSVLGLVMVFTIIFLAVFAPYVTPYPQHAGKFVDFKNKNQPPSWQHLMGTDTIGRDILSRIIFSFRNALLMAIVVLSVSVSLGTLTGLTAGYYSGTRVDIVIMRVTDVFISIPPIILALSIAAVLKPTLMNAMIAVTISWWPWYTRMTYSLASSIKNEYYVQAAELTGASKIYILFSEILPNCSSSLFTKMALDVGWVTLVGAALSFVGLGEQPPKPALGTMIAEGVERMPGQWWIALFPALAIMFLVLGFNLFGDGIRDALSPEEA
ncbi:ABC transporter permease [Candidatus Atribacteria bacterium 1244-E10-H5-B2]|nr:MAG: ABC transporter permease [Candidatus Atribacteria bacterium 1244-E10-H5-B2]